MRPDDIDRRLERVGMRKCLHGPAAGGERN